MAFTSTLNSLRKKLTSNIDLSNYATKTELNSKANTSDLATIATSGSYNDLANKPTLFSGDYADLDNKPTLFSGSYNDLANKPTLFSGDYTDLTNKPTIPDISSYATKTELASKANSADLATIATSGSYNDLSNKPTLFSGSYNDLTNKPTIPDTNNFVTNSDLTANLAHSLEKSVTVTSANNTFTIDPNNASLFLINATSNSTIAISNLTSTYTSTGSVFSILLTLGSDGLAISWPNNISWNDGEAPTLTYKNLITLIKFDNSSNWVGGCTVVDSTFPSA